MNSHFCVLPTDMIQFLSQSLQAQQARNSKEPRMFCLPHPRTNLPSLFLPTEGLSEQSSILEVQAVSPPDERSWMTGDEVVADGKLLVMTSIDPSFLLLPIMRATQPLDDSTGQFRPAEDLFEEASKRLETPNEADSNLSIQSQDIVDFCSFLCVRKCLNRICEVKEITTELTVYRYCPSKALKYMQAKVARLCKSPAFEKSQTLIRNLAKDGLMEDGKEELLSLGRLRAACDLISQYLPSDMREALINTYDFAKLQTELNRNKEEAIATAATATSVKAQAKGQKVTADKKRKAPKPSVGVEKLKKVNTNGMSKLSSFFNKA